MDNVIAPDSNKPEIKRQGENAKETNPGKEATFEVRFLS